MRTRDFFKKDKIEILKSMGAREQDIPQIKQGFKFLQLTKNGNKITKEQAIEELGTETFLSGLVRASFHWTCARYSIKTDELISFDCSKMFLD